MTEFEALQSVFVNAMYAVHVNDAAGEEHRVSEVSDQHLRPSSKLTVKPHPCDRCSKSFSSIHQLSQHTRVRHILKW